MIVDQDAHPPHHLPSRSRHRSGTASHDRQALVPPWAPLAHALAHSRGDGHQAQPEGLETIPSRSAQGLHLPREARSRLERSVEASIDHVSRAAVCHIPGSEFGRHGSGSNFWRGRQVRKSAEVLRCLFSDSITKNRCSQPTFCTVGGSGPNLLCLTSHPCSRGQSHRTAPSLSEPSLISVDTRAWSLRYSLSKRSKSECRKKFTRQGQARPLHPAARSRVVDLRRAETPTVVGPAEDVELATHRCGGVTKPISAHADQLRPYVGLRVVHAD